MCCVSWPALGCFFKCVFLPAFGCLTKYTDIYSRYNAFLSFLLPFHSFNGCWVWPWIFFNNLRNIFDNTFTNILRAVVSISLFLVFHSVDYVPKIGFWYPPPPLKKAFSYISLFPKLSIFLSPTFVEISRAP